MMQDLQYRDNDYFNETDTYMFHDGYKYFESKVYFNKSCWWTCESLNYKCTSVKSKKLNNG